ncbi:MAG: VWA domain-containing protein [Phycisphaerales bacterium]
MTLRFEHPAWLLLALLAVPMAITAVRWFSSMSRVRRWSAAVLRVVLIGLIAGMLAGATAIRTSEKIAVIAVIDVSGSVQRFAARSIEPSADAGAAAPERGPGGRLLDRTSEFLREASKSRKPDDVLGVVVFDGDAAAVVAPTRVDALDRVPYVSMSEGTNIERAIRLAAAMIPPDSTPRLVLFSDGVETDGDAIRAVSDLASASRGAGAPTGTGDAAGRAGVPIDVVPLAYNVTREVFVESVDAPPQAPDGSVISVRVVLETAGASQGTLELLREGQPMDINGDDPGTGRRLSLVAGRHVEVIPVRLPKGRLHQFDAIYVPDPAHDEGEATGAADGRAVQDTIASNNRAQAFTFTPGTGSVLLIGGLGAAGTETLASALPDTLRDAGLDVTIVTPDGIPSDALRLQAYDLVILDNVPADAFEKPAQEMLAAYVTEQGGGLVMIGGRQSFGAGGWKGTAIEPILPVQLDLPEKLIVPAVAIVFVLDNSGSMRRHVMGSTRTQQYIANEGAAIAVRSLDKTDLVGVVTFNNQYDVLVRLSKNTDSLRTADAIRSIRPDGGTNIPPALEEAGRQLDTVTADFKHVIVLTDGRSQNKDELPGLAGRLKEKGIHVTTIGIGDDCDEATLRAMASRGDGVFYPVSDPTTLPRIFVRAVRVVRSPMVREARFTPVPLATGSAIIEKLPSPIPPLGGISLTQPRGDPLVTTAMLHPAGEPVLAHWNVGLGRVAAFTSGAAEWSSEWIPTPTYKQFWTDLARLISRPESDRAQELTIEAVGSDLHIRLDATSPEGKPLDLLSVPGWLYAPSGERTPIRLSQTGPGAYETTVRAPASGNHVVALAPRLGNKALPPVIGGISRASGIEYRRLQSNIGLLEEIAARSGGRVYDLKQAGVNLYDRSGVKPTEARLPLWRTLLLWAIVVLMLDIGTRRIAWDRLVSREFGASMREQARAAMASRAGQSERALRRLKKVEEEREAAVASEAQPAPLSSDDARAIVRAEAERRRAARAARQGEPNPPGPSGEPPIAAQPAEPNGSVAESAPPAPEPEGGGLFAAKRRAQARIEREQDR